MSSCRGFLDCRTGKKDKAHASPLDEEQEKRRASVCSEDVLAVRTALQQRGGHVDPADDLIHMFLRATSNNVHHVCHTMRLPWPMYCTVARAMLRFIESPWIYLVSLLRASVDDDGVAAQSADNALPRYSKAACMWKSRLTSFTSVWREEYSLYNE